MVELLTDEAFLALWTCDGRGHVDCFSANHLSREQIKQDTAFCGKSCPCWRHRILKLSARKSEPAKQLEASIRLGIAAEEDWDGPSVEPGELSDEKISWLASWLAGDGFAKKTRDDYSPITFGETKNTLGSFQMAGLQAPDINMERSAISEFQAERLLEAGYVILYDPVRAKAILKGRKS